MRTEIKLSKDEALIVEPSYTPGMVFLMHSRRGLVGPSISLTQDQAGALLFGLEQAAEAASIAKDREEQQAAERAAKVANETGNAVIRAVQPIPPEKAAQYVVAEGWGECKVCGAPEPCEFCVWEGQQL